METESNNRFSSEWKADPLRQTEKGHGTTMEEAAHPSTLGNNKNPFLYMSDATTSTNESSSWKNQPFAYETTVPNNINAEPHHEPLPVTQQGHENLGSSNDVWTPFSSSRESPKLGADHQLQVAAGSSDDDIPISSMPNHAQQHSPSASNEEVGINTKRSEIQNPPVQVMERPAGSGGGDSDYIFPSHVFARNGTNATPGDWSTASNESLFSIYMGNMSFSNELISLGKSAELDNPGASAGGAVSMFDPSLASPPSTQPQQLQPPAPAPPVSKFTDISQRTAELHEESTRENEVKAFETMREVIMETSRTANKADKGDVRSSNHKPDGSTKSRSADKDKSVASKSGEQKQQKQPENQQETTPQNAPKPTTNAPSSGGWLSCFLCCNCCH